VHAFAPHGMQLTRTMCQIARGAFAGKNSMPKILFTTLTLPQSLDDLLQRKDALIEANETLMHSLQYRHQEEVARWLFELNDEAKGGGGEFTWRDGGMSGRERLLFKGQRD
jgi:hypothetical protein